ncbi:hypothetical protein [Halobacillus naozhouensis]|uniref:Uncharacterized protein n=1 Tax=Halobacillus naozhouensis TaxID=554880 RepID=A0ABY8IXA8_9BACI|nr:hypothetical protein [Halobacillus naozhouensis]WFT74882.1 hypothetical protein P9989_00130 [Halobacillus naozhouensis]
MNNYRDPGTGAIEFAREYVQGLDELEALSVINSLLNGELHDSTDKRIKRCNYCGYHYKDNTRPNNAKVCSHECREARKVINRTRKRRTAKPPKPTKKDIYYVKAPDGYDFWINEREMLKYFDNRETVFDDKKIEQIAAAKHRKESMGGKKTPKYTSSYQGDEKGAGTDHRVNVRFVENKEARKPGEVITTKIDPEEVKAYLIEEYGEHKLFTGRETIRTIKKH